ncbi:hypothetical protein DF3PB_670002 [uncultured Defluviicoccus sp.]|uniref:Uncharacterized protein n=1 Tax=metagenome TaxID=256318 RepID=A0A380TC11_9ZZZZ|nr:hypothetical protein DF3PB_160007 [uncultured Defluviicoccus sp.]SUS08411.1 hypothetical protein DF3PB_670002 [uncultured Defluviicoccus sp.]
MPARWDLKTLRSFNRLQVRSYLGPTFERFLKSSLGKMDLPLKFRALMSRCFGRRSVFPTHKFQYQWDRWDR